MRRGAYAPKNALDAVGFSWLLSSCAALKPATKRNVPPLFFLRPSVRGAPPPHMNDAAVSPGLPPSSVFSGG